MGRRPDTPGGAGRYTLSFILTVVVLGGLTLLLVLVVLPRRFLLSAGLRESGVTFPSQVIPFSPPPEPLREPLPPAPPPPEAYRGPGEAFWTSVEPLLAKEQFWEALPLFEAYLSQHTEDEGVLREYGITLARAGRPLDAVGVFQRILADREDPRLRRLLARTLRDSGRLDEASAQYALLMRRGPKDPSLPLEWGRALAWGRRYLEASQVLTEAMDRFPAVDEIRLELAHVYFWSGRIGAADRVLAGLDQDRADGPEAQALRTIVAAALAPPTEDPETASAHPERPPPSVLDRANRALAEGDHEEAARLLVEALEVSPGEAELWETYADILQFRLEDLEGARNALLRVAELEDPDPGIRYRLAQLALWTGRNDEAEARLEGLLEDSEAKGVSPGEEEEEKDEWSGVQAHEILALLGDLHRWKGDRPNAGKYYEEALQADSANQRAAEGIRELEGELAREVENFEEPGPGGAAYSIADSDGFSRLDLGAEAVGVRGDWVWSLGAGQRWLEGSDLLGTQGREQGLFVEMESARWWGWGTARSGLRLGLEQIQSGRTDLVLGASLRWTDLGGFQTDLRYDHGPAYPLVLTFQSLVTHLEQDRLNFSLARMLGERWSLSLAGDVARIHTNDKEMEGFSGTMRLEGGVSLGRVVSESLVLGMNARGLTFTREAPSPNGTQLFWDPRYMTAGGVYAQFRRRVEDGWDLRARVNPGLAAIHERRGAGSSLVPHLSTELGLSHLGQNFRTHLDLFYYQGRFDGYRAYGMRLSFSAKDWFPGGRGS